MLSLQGYGCSFKLLTMSPQNIRQWVEVGGVLYPEYEHEEESTLTEDAPKSELELNTAIALNNLLSAQYQLSHLERTIIPQEQRIKYAIAFLENAIKAVQKIREELK